MGTMGDAIANATTQSEISNFYIDKIGQIWVASYEVKGDGSDETSKVQDAVDAANAAGLTEVYFTGGKTYLINTLTNTSGITFIGDNVTITGTSGLSAKSFNSHFGEIENQNKSLVLEKDVEVIRSKLKSGEGLLYCCLGDSTEVGIGNSGNVYGECQNILNYSGHDIFAMSLILNDENFIAPDINAFEVTEPTAGAVPVPIKSHQLIASDNPDFTYNFKQDGNNKIDNLTIYYIERTNSAAPTFDVVCGGVTTTVDTYVSALEFGSVTDQTVIGRIGSANINIPTASTSFSVQINNLQLVDRGSGVASDGTVIILGFALGQGVKYRNLGVSSTTLLNNSSANQSRGVTTEGQLQKAYDFGANIISIGWGTNDSKTGVSSVEAYKIDLKTRIDEIRAENENTIIVLTSDPLGATGSLYENNELYFEAMREVAREKICNFIDVMGIIKAYTRSNIIADDVHPNNLGYQIIGEALSIAFKLQSNINTKLSAENTYTMYYESTNGTNQSDSSGNYVEIDSITFETPKPLKNNIFVIARIALGDTADINAEFKLVLNGAILDDAYVKIVGSSSDLRIGQAVLELMYALGSSSSYTIALQGKNFRTRALNDTKLSVMFF